MNQVVVISPSGSFYGSEQVLYDYLSATSHHVSVIVRGKGLFYDKLRSLSLQIAFFTEPMRLYSKIAWNCLLGNVKVVYLNEAGHSKYIRILSRLFRKVKFVLHIRIVEDANPGRWPKLLPRNVEVVTISSFMQQLVPVPNTLVYDPYIFSLKKSRTRFDSTALCVGVIGRICVNKGIDNIINLLKFISCNGSSSRFKFHLFGTIDEEVKTSDRLVELKRFDNVVLEGFVENKEQIYSKVDCVLHAAAKEPLGRIYLEAIDYSIPFIGINSGGIGEIASLTNLRHLNVADDQHLTVGMYHRLEHVAVSYDQVSEEMQQAKEKAREIFSLVKYTQAIDKLLHPRI